MKMSYQRCCLCKGKGVLKQDPCPVCLGERILNKKTGLPPSKYVAPYQYVPYYPYYPTYPVYKPTISWEVSSTDGMSTVTSKEYPFTLTNN